METRLSVRYAPGTMRPCQEAVLARGACSLFLPASIVRERDGSCLFLYHTEGLVPLPMLDAIRASDLIELAAAILQGSAEAEDRYLFRGEYDVEQELIYLKQNGKRLHFAGMVWRMAGSSSGEEGGRKLRRDVANLLEIRSGSVQTEARGYMKKAGEIILRPHSGLYAAANRLRLLEAEAEACGY